jgi:hypothetical protein
MTITRLFIVFLSAILFLSPVFLHAKEKVGTALVDGNKIELYSDRTWSYADNAADSDASCAEIQLGVAFCGSELGWKLVSGDGIDIAAQFRLNDRTYGLFIIEGLGSEDGVKLEFMRDTVVNGFADAGGLAKKDVTVFGIEDSSVSDVSAETIVYGGNFNGVNVVFSNTIVIQENLTVQVATYVLGVEPTERSKALHQEFLAQTKLK